MHSLTKIDISLLGFFKIKIIFIMDGNKYVDITFLRNMTGGDDLIINEIVHLFKMEVPKYLDEMQLHINNKNWYELSAAAHKAKSSFALMGISDIVGELKTIELLSKDQKEIETYQEILKKVEFVYNDSLKELDDILKK
jgi:HPt (histidine-containing phosphotransfer) domain-containing protein